MSWMTGREFRFWQSVAIRWLGIVLLGGFVIVWFQGCLVSSTREEIQQEQRKSLDSSDMSQP